MLLHSSVGKTTEDRCNMLFLLPNETNLYWKNNQPLIYFNLDLVFLYINKIKIFRLPEGIEHHNQTNIGIFNPLNPFFEMWGCFNPF